MGEHVGGGTAEHLESGSGRPLSRTRRTKSSGRRKLVAGVSALAVLGAAAGGVWAWQSLMGQGTQPAEALPASTLAYVAVDFDPAGGQKLAALGFLRKFPSLEKHTGLTSSGDLRENVFDGLKSDLDCNLGYDDLAPWVGTRFAFALVQQDRPQPVVVVQVDDHEKAQSGLKRIAGCAGGDLGYALGNEWAVLAETDRVAEGVARDAAASPLSRDPDFQHWTGLAGDPGVATLYAAPEAGPALVSAAEDSPYGAAMLPSEMTFDPLSMLMVSGLAMPVTYGSSGSDYAVTSEARPARPGRVHRPTRAELRNMRELDRKLQRLDEMTPAEQRKLFKKQDEIFQEQAGQSIDPIEEVDGVGFPKPAIPADQREALMHFSGLGGVVRFDDGALELEMVSDRIEGTMGNLVAGTAGDDVLTALPADTAAAFGLGLRDGWGAAFVQRFSEMSMPFSGKQQANPAARFESATGLTAADLEALGGDSVAVAAGAGANPGRVLWDPAGARVAARISGNADAVEAALAKVQATIPGPDRVGLQWRRVGDDVLVGANGAYLDELAGAGGLAGTGSFTDAVPDAGDAASVFYLDFDAGDWLTKTVDAPDRADAEPLAGFGYSLRDEGDRERTLLRLTTQD